MQVSDLAGMDWGGSTDINAAFKLILDCACAAKLPQEQMLDTLFIFSDMHFDAATAIRYSYYHATHQKLKDNDTNFHQVKAKFAQQGYKLPKVVFWNLRGPGMNEQASTPVTCTENGTALVSGFSGQLLKLFMGGVNDLESYNPFNVMKEAIAAEKYNSWRVVD